MKVKFVPSVDDYIYIASKINEIDSRKSLDRYAFVVFLSINIVCFPAFLFLTNHIYIALGVFLLNLAFYLFCISGMNARHYRHYYERTIGSEVKEVEVELTSDGVSRFYDGDVAIVAWKNILGIEERLESIFFHFRGGAVAVRKSAFDNDVDKDAFLRLAKEFRQAP